MVTSIADCIWYFNHLPLLSHDQGHVAWIEFSFGIFWYPIELILSCGLSFTRHSLFGLDLGIFVLLDLVLVSACPLHFPLSFYTGDIVATWSVSHSVGRPLFRTLFSLTIPRKKCQFELTLGPNSSHAHQKERQLYWLPLLAKPNPPEHGHLGSMWLERCVKSTIRLTKLW
jgi:hypothetical protein